MLVEKHEGDTFGYISLLLDFEQKKKKKKDEADEEKRKGKGRSRRIKTAKYG